MLISGRKISGTETGSGATAFANELGSAGDSGGGGQVVHPQSVLLDSGLQFADSDDPVRAPLEQGTSTQLANAIFKAAGGHRKSHRRRGISRMHARDGMLDTLHTVGLGIFRGQALDFKVTKFKDSRFRDFKAPSRSCWEI